MPKVEITNEHCMEHAGICLKCGFAQGGCEPDARNYECESCGEKAVMGVPEALVCGVSIASDTDMDALQRTAFNY